MATRAPFQVFVYPFRQAQSGHFEYALFRRRVEGYWQGIAGGGEGAESPLEAARREAFEEASIPQSAQFDPLTTQTYVPVDHFRERTHWPQETLVIPVYYFAVHAANLEIVLSDEHSECCWTTFEVGEPMLHWDSDKTALWELSERLRRDL